MKYTFVLVLGLLPLSAQAADNQEGFQATRQLTGELLNDKESFGGKVIDTMDVADYTYVQFAHGKEKLWLATSKTKVKKGDIVSFTDPTTMHKFHSKSLNRTFDQIYFVSTLNVKTKF
ncbi:NrfJ-related protein [Oligoflexus tunisiensis]|uniref:NrfJ-related protein n=1 Tax=Oligoflexus tunisiensis TaxID=708132 RepID=UPI00114D29E6|nr:NrfJ-related protein [Oligoflexus tunisiensis]